MDIRSFKKALPFLLKNRITPFLHGSQGIGKTQSVYQYCKENNLGCVVLHTATQDVGDLIGLLVKGKDEDTVHHARPEWFPTEGNGILFLDELNRAPQDVIQAMFPLITEGRLHRHVLPEGWRVVAAGNYQSDRFNVTDTSDAAWLSRFCHIDFTPTVEEWTVYADAKGLLDTAAFIREQPSMLELSAKDAGRLNKSFIVPDRRAWAEGIGALEAESSLPEDLRYELYSGLVGETAAAAFISWKAKAERSLSLPQILDGYKTQVVRDRVQTILGDKKAMRFDLLNGPLDELLVKLEVSPGLLDKGDRLENLKRYLLDVPYELSMKVFSKMSKMQMFSGKNALLNDPVYVALFAAVRPELAPLPKARKSKGSAA